MTFYRKYVKIVDQQDVNLQSTDPQTVNQRSADRETEVVKLVFPEHYEEAGGKYAGTDFIYTAPRYGK